MKHGLILFPRSTANCKPTAFEWWISEARACNLDVRVVFFEDVMMQEPYGKPDFVVMRGYEKSVSLRYEHDGVRVFSPWTAMACSRNKLLTAQRLEQASVPTPPAFLCTRGFKYAASRLGLPFVVKQIDGSRGVNVFLINTEEEYSRAMLSCGGHALAQQYVAASHGQDIRIWVVGDKAVGAVLRKSETKFVSNYAQGGKASLYTPDKEAIRLAIEATRAVGLDFSGIDLLFDGKGHYTVCEVNANAGFRTLSAVSDINILQEFMRYISDNV